MQIKYTVYYKKDEKLPQVDIWQTKGEMVHPVYEKQHNISPKDVSSRGYLYFNPIFQRWLLEHYQMDEGIPARTIKEFMQKRRIEKRDRLLVRKKFYYTDFSKNSQLKKETWQDKKKISWCTLKQLFGFQNN